jgi:hypothetical protein
MSKWYLFPVFVLVFYACKKDVPVPLSPHQNPYVVIEGMFTDSLKKHQFTFTLTSNLGSSDPSPATAENVQIETPTGVVNYVHLGNGLYESETAFKGIYGENYTISFNYQGKNHTVITRMPYPVNYSEFDFYPIIETSYDSLGFSVPKSKPVIYFNAETPVEQYLSFKFFIAEQDYLPADTNWNEIEIPFYRIIRLKAGLNENINLPFDLSDQVYPLNTDLIKIEFRALSKDFANYLLKLKDYEKGVASDDQFYNPPFFFSNEAYGIAFGTVIDSVIYQY